MDSGLEYVPEEHLKKFATLLDRASFLGKAEAAQNDFMTYCKMVWPEFVNGRHHGIMAEKFNRLATGDLKRLIVNMPPRHTKSEFGSYLLPSWLMGKRPTLKIMQTTHTAELAFRFGRKTRNLMNSQDTVEYLMLSCERIAKLLDDGKRLRVGNILRLVLVER